MVDQPFGMKSKANEDPFKRYEGQFILIGSPTELIRGGRIEEIHHDGMFVKPYVFRMPHGYELRDYGAQFLSNGSVGEITPISQKDLEEMLENVNERINENGDRRNGKKSTILRPEQVRTLWTPNYEPTFRMPPIFVPGNGHPHLYRGYKSL